jgi:hypothetical protein
MPYIGKEPVIGSFRKLDNITPNGGASYSLLYNGAAYDPGQAERLIVSVNGVTQAPGVAYTVSGNTITFTANVTASDVIDYIVGMGDVYDVGSVSDGTITPAKLASTLVLDDTPIRTNVNTLDNAVTVAANQNAFVAGPVTINAALTINGTFTVV